MREELIPAAEESLQSRWQQEQLQQQLQFIDSSKARLHGLMAIVNATPDSFSDGGDYFSAAAFEQRMLSLLQNPQVQAIDVGAQSTAPSVPVAVGPQEEIRRLETLLLPFLEQHAQLFSSTRTTSLSIDTYHPDVFRHIYARVTSAYPQINLWWNDVSGIIDENLLWSLLQECPRCTYVLGHSFVKSREDTQRHMQFIVPEQGTAFLMKVQEHFTQATNFFQRHGLLERIVFDPCFGFAKDRQQNLFLLENLAQLLHSQPPQQTWLIGISRKSFLRFLATDSNPSLSAGGNWQQSEKLHRYYLTQWHQIFPQQRLLFRVHDTSSTINSM